MKNNSNNHLFISRERKTNREGYTVINLFSLKFHIVEYVCKLLAGREAVLFSLELFILFYLENHD